MNAVVFALLYIVCMIPTYALPYLGSNSGAVNTTVLAASGGMSPLFLVHAATLVAAIVLALWRGKSTRRLWLVIFPVLAAVFDLIPVLNWVPLVPTVMHLLAVILGVMGGQALAPAPQQVKAA